VTPYTGGTRVPAFWRWTGTLPAGVDTASLTCHWDILPTLAGLIIWAIVALGLAIWLFVWKEVAA
jgi:hypothetical protein